MRELSREASAMLSIAQALQPQGAFCASLPTGGTILDVGCNDFGRVQRYVGRHRRDLTIVGLEKFEGDSIYGPLEPPPAIPGGPVFRRLKCDIEEERFAFADDTFDGAYMSHVIEHLEKKAPALAEIARVLKPGALFYIETPGPASRNVRRPAFVPERLGGTIAYHDDPTHLGDPMTTGELSALLQAAGLRVERTGTFRELGAVGMPLYASMATAGLLPLPSAHLRDRLYGAGMRNLIGFAIYAIARKPDATR